MPLRQLFLIEAALLGLNSCSHSNNLLLGEVEAKLASHDVRVTDCYRAAVPEPILAADRQTWEPCRDAKILIDGDRLTVNGKNYGSLGAADSVFVDHGAVSVQRNPVPERAQR